MFSREERAFVTREAQNELKLMDAVIDQLIGDFVEKIRDVGEIDELRSIFESTVGQLGFRYFTCHIVRVPGLGNRLPYVVTTYPDQWVSHYISEGYVQVDPILSQGPKSVVPFSWNDIALPDALSEVVPEDGTGS